MSLRKLCAPALLFTLTLLFAPCVTAQEDARAQAAAEIESLRAQIKAKEAALLGPSKEDRRAHADFLAQPNTGLVRLLPREGGWDGKLSMRGGGAFYSFSRMTHEYGNGSDIMLEQEMLSAGFAGANFGFMANLGDVPVETVSGETEGVRYMASFQTPSPEPDARKAQRQFGGGFQSGQWIYKNRLPVSVGTTYALRSVNYDYSDVLVAFRVLRKDSDGSVVLLWKMLQEFPKPTLARNLAPADGQ
jgi:hypothetical protein